MGLFSKNDGRVKPPTALDVGWQLYARPTTLDPPGTVFRIDDSGRRYGVDTLDLPVHEGGEASGRLEQRLQASAGMLARFLELQPLNLGLRGRVGASETLIFELHDTLRHATHDVEVDAVLDPWLKTLRYRPSSRYFLIREARSAMGINLRISKTMKGQLEASAALPDFGELSAQAGRDGENRYVLSRKFIERMRVSFLAEEIKPITAALGGGTPELGRVPVRETLIWTEEE